MKVGDYVRTKYGIIAKINDIIEDLSIDCDIDVYYEDSLKDKMPMMEIPYNLKNEYIIKSSPNIIDLIEVGDYLNGFRVCDSTCGLVIIAPTEDIQEMNSIKDEFRNNGLFVSKVYKLEDIEIKSIITKEMYSSVEYKIGE